MDAERCVCTGGRQEEMIGYEQEHRT